MRQLAESEMTHPPGISLGNLTSQCSNILKIILKETEESAKGSNEHKCCTSWCCEEYFGCQCCSRLMYRASRVKLKRAEIIAMKTKIPNIFFFSFFLSRFHNIGSWEYNNFQIWNSRVHSNEVVGLIGGNKMQHNPDDTGFEQTFTQMWVEHQVPLALSFIRTGCTFPLRRGRCWKD